MKTNDNVVQPVGIDMNKHRCRCGKVPHVRMNQLGSTFSYVIECPECEWSTGNRVLLSMEEALELWDDLVNGWVTLHADGFEPGDYWYEILQHEKDDPVNSPYHYKQHELECIDEMVIMFGAEAVIAHCKCCAWKYRYREDYKGNKDQDNAKADWYIKKAQELQAGLETTER